MLPESHAVAGILLVLVCLGYAIAVVAGVL